MVYGWVKISVMVRLYVFAHFLRKFLFSFGKYRRFPLSLSYHCTLGNMYLRCTGHGWISRKVLLDGPFMFQERCWCILEEFMEYCFLWEKRLISHVLHSAIWSHFYSAKCGGKKLPLKNMKINIDDFGGRVTRTAVKGLIVIVGFGCIR